MIKSTYVKSKKQYKVSFELPQNHVGEGRDVRVLGNFNEWSWDDGLQLKTSKGNYTGSTELPAGNYEFRYLVDGHHWANDDSADSYSDSGHGSSNSCFSLEAVEEAKKKSKPAAKDKSTDKIEAAKSAPASKPVVTPAEEKRKSSGLQQAAEKKAATKKSSTKKATAKKSTKKAVKKDDLKKIEGIGPKIAGLLNDAGIKSFTDLSKATEKQLADVIQEAGARFRLAKHDTWQEQAKLAAEGKTDELKKLQAELKGGKR